MRFPGMFPLLAQLAMAAAIPAGALTHSVTDFRLDSTANAVDKFRLDPGWGDSLLMLPRKFEYKVAGSYRMNPPKQGNVDVFPAGNAVATATGPYTFKVGFVQFQSVHTSNNFGTNSHDANIMYSNIVLDPDTVLAQENGTGTIIAGGEIPGAFPAPVYLNYFAEGDNYAAYWGPNIQKGPVRRTNQVESAVGGSNDSWGKPVNPSAPILVGGFGKVGACLQPGSGGLKYALAYEMDTTFPAGKFEIRWEDIGANTTSAATPIAVTPTPEDFALSMDSLGNTVALFRKELVIGNPTDIWLVAYNPAHAKIIDTVRIETDIYSEDSVGPTPVAHYYRPYAIASQANKRFLIAYSKTISGETHIWTRTLTLDSVGAGSYTLSAALRMTPAADVAPFHYMYPDITITADRVVMAWFKRTNTARVHRIMGSIFNKAGPVMTTAGRIDMDFSNENLTYNLPMTGTWYQYHYMKTASVALDQKGNIVTAYDNGWAAKASVVRNTPYFYDSSAFQSRVLQVENPSVPTFIFDPAKDSVAFQPLRMTATDSARAVLKLATSTSASFAGSNFQTVPGRLPVAAGYYRYKVEMKTNFNADTTLSHIRTARVKAMDIDYNVKPWRPVVDSIKPGPFPIQAYSSSAAYSLLPRKDSLKIVCTGFDADDSGLTFRISLGTQVLKSAAGVRAVPGTYTAGLTILPPDTVLNPLPLTVTTIDPSGWVSQSVTMLFDYSNITPTQAITLFRNKGRDSANVYRPSGGGTDTLQPANNDLIVMQAGDSLSVKARYADGNDDAVTATWLRNSAQLGTRLIPTSDSLIFKFSPDNAAPVIDTIVIRVGDPNITTTLRYAVRPNRMPEIDSIFHSAYKAKDSLWKTGPFDRLRDFVADTGLILPAGLMTVVDLGVSDSDLTFGDSMAVKWRVWKQANGCARGDLSCYIQVDSADGAPLTRVFNTQEQYLTVRVTDNSGAFRQYKVWLEYPVLDTTAVTSGFAAAVKAMKNDIDFIIGSEDHDTTVRAEIVSQGSFPLQITSVATKSDDRKWLNVKLEWLTGTPPRPDSVKFTGATTANALTNGKIISLPPGAKLTFNFRFASDSLRGDSSFIDTLLVATNDFANPILKIPFRMVYNDLPVMTLGVPGSAASGPAGGYNAAGLPRFVPARSTLSVSFTETVRVPNPSAVFRVYSYLDSLKAKRDFKYINGSYALVRTRLPKLSADSRGMAFGKAAAAVAADSLADQIVFTPDYDRASDSLGVKPQPGFFIYRDIIRVKLNNGIVDRAGNGLDLRLNKKAAAPGSIDTVFQARIDTSFFKVTETEPAAGSLGWSPEAPIRVYFNRKLAKAPPAGTDSLTLLATGSLKAADSRGVRVTSVYRPGRAYDLQSLSLDDGDSTLVIRTRPRLAALDTVTVTLSGGLVDTSGLSLDGNGNHFPDWLYDRRDSIDAFTFTFSTNDAEFYIYPNPFRFSDSRHREKGTITFKNLNSLRGYAKAAEVTLRIHTMGGDLVFNSDTRSTAPAGSGRRINTSLDWDLKNNHGTTIGTGVYLYSLMSGGRTLLQKGKVAVVR